MNNNESDQNDKYFVTLVIVLLVIVQAWRIRTFDIPDAHQHH